MTTLSVIDQTKGTYHNKDVLLVDFFDTCVTRDIHPEYIKYLWAARTRELLGLKISSDETYRIRAGVELELCIKNKNAGLDDDFHFPEFSRVFYQHIDKNYKKLSNFYTEAQFIDLSSEIELYLEFEHQILLEETIQYLKREKDSGKELILVSDFYLSKHEFNKLLEHHNIADLFSDLYVSSEYSKTKRSGKLFDLIIKECNLDPSRVTMIGDNLHSDFECPKSKGLNAIHLDKSSKRAKDEELFRLETSLPHTSQSIWNEVNTLLGKGPIFANISLTLYSFINRLHRKLRENDVKDVFFLSREGEFLKRLFDLYQEKLTLKNRIKSHYFLASRKSTFLPSLKSLNEENFEILFRQYVNISGKEFLLSLNLDEAWVEQFENKFSADLKIRETHFPSSQTFSSILANQSFRDEYERKRKEQKELFLAYLSSFGVDLDKAEFSIVDVGWKGSMQDNIKKILPEKVTIHGYYLGLYTSHNITEKNKKEGIIFSPLPSATEYGAWIFSNTLTVYEILLGASHGSATEYTKDVDGNINVSLMAHVYETKLYNEKIAPLLNHYYEIFSELSNIFKQTHFNIEYFDRMIAEFHASMILMPKEEEITFIETVSHFENFGIFEFTEFKANSVSLHKKVINLISFFRNPHETLKDSMWPAITFRKLGIPYLRHFYGWYQFKLAFDNQQSRTFKVIRSLWRI